MARATLRDKELLTSDTVLLPDRWLYRWTGVPPRAFLLQKTLFRVSSPGEIAISGWQVLTAAVAELARTLQFANVGTGIDWLKLNSACGQPVLLGLHADETVTAATACSAVRRPFIPARFQARLAADRQWRNVRYFGSQRHFLARFSTGRSFYTERHKLLCDLEFLTHFGVHGVHTLTGSIRINDRQIAIPLRLRISDTLSDLPGKVERLTRFGERFVGRLGAAWLRERDEEQLAQLALAALTGTNVPAWQRNSLKKDRDLLRCLTRLDLILILAKLFDSDSFAAQAGLFKISQFLYSMR